jgi:CheY-like chemotaxis protein
LLTYLSTMKILFVEDHPDLLRFACLGLGHLGYEVMTATDGEEAVKMTAALRPDLIVMDIMLPKMDGLQATAEIRQNPETLYVPILVATGMGSAEERNRALASGCNGFVSKPYSFAELGNAIREVVKYHGEPLQKRRNRIAVSRSSRIRKHFHPRFENPRFV